MKRFTEPYVGRLCHDGGCVGGSGPYAHLGRVAGGGVLDGWPGAAGAKRNNVYGSVDVSFSCGCSCSHEFFFPKELGFGDGDGARDSFRRFFFYCR